MRVKYIDVPAPETAEEWLARAKEQQVRFWAKIDSSGTGCWEWFDGKIDKNGYGRFSITGRGPRFKGDRPVQKQIGAHRLAWQLANDSVVADDLVVMHACDNPPCCNPAHLSVGTQADNRTDCVEKGRQPRGEASAKAKITNSIALEILSSKDTQIETAARFGISRSTVRNIRSGKAWAHLSTGVKGG